MTGPPPVRAHDNRKSDRPRSIDRRTRARAYIYPWDGRGPSPYPAVIRTTLVILMDPVPEGRVAATPSSWRHCVRLFTSDRCALLSHEHLPVHASLFRDTAARLMLLNSNDATRRRLGFAPRGIKIAIQPPSSSNKRKGPSYRQNL